MTSPQVQQINGMCSKHPPRRSEPANCPACRARISAGREYLVSLITDADIGLLMAGGYDDVTPPKELP